MKTAINIALLSAFGLFNLTTSAHEIKCGTAHFTQEWKQQQLNGNRAMFNPPVLTGTEVIHLTSHFEIHYTVTGADAVSTVDVDGNSVPDIVDTIETAAEYSFNDYYLRGYMLPPRDGIGNDSGKYDIYLINMSFHYGAGFAGLYAFTAPYNDIGNNPASAETELHSASSFIALRREYTVFTPNTNPSVDIEVTVAHEFSHAIDFSYSLNVSFWFTEARAAYEESVVYPFHTENFTYLPDIFTQPDAALNLDQSDSIHTTFPNHFYAGWIFNRYCHEHIEPDFLKPVLALMRGKTAYSNRNDFELMDQSFKSNYETTFREQFVNWVVANYFLSPLPKFEPHTYSRGIDYANSLTAGGISFEGAANYSGSPFTLTSVTDGNSRLMRMSADYWIVSTDRNFSIRMDAQGNDTSYNLIVVKQNSTTGDYEMEVCGYYKDSIWAASIRDHDKWDDYIVIVARYDGWTTDTMSKQYTLSFNEPLMFLNWNYKNSGFLYGSNFSVAVDHSNLLWTTNSFASVTNNGFAVGGVTAFNGYNWQHYHYYNTTRKPGTFSFPGGGNLNDIDVSADNHVWFSDPNSGLYEYDRSIWELHDDDNVPQTGNWGEKMDARNNSKVWCAINGKGLFEINGGVITHATSPSLQTSCVRFAAGRKFVGTHDAGLIVDNGGSITVYDTTNGLAAMSVTDVEVDKQGNWWVGSYGKGVSMYNGTTWTIYDPWNPPGAYLGTRIMNIEVDDSGTVWIANQNDGITRYKNNTWHTYDQITSPEFPAYSVWDIAFDKRGCLYLGTDNGLVYFCDTVDNTPVVSVEETAFPRSTAIKLFPNPVNDVLNVCSGADLFKENTALNIFDINGRRLKSITNHLNTNLLKLDISDLNSGVYLIETNNTRAKFVKM